MSAHDTAPLCLPPDWTPHQAPVDRRRVTGPGRHRRPTPTRALRARLGQLLAVVAFVAAPAQRPARHGGHRS